MDVSYILKRVENNIQTIDPDKIALKLESNETWTYGELNHITNKYAQSLQRMGVEKGDRVGILLYNCLEYFALYFAAAKIGAIAVRINFRLSSEEYDYVLNNSGTKVLCFHSGLAEKIDAIRNSVDVDSYICLEQEGYSVPEWAHSWAVLDNEDPSAIDDVMIDKSDPVMLMYTSGTTGKPKGALWSHENTLWFASSQALKWDLSEITIGLATGPLYHVGAMEDMMLSVLLKGGTVIITTSGGFNIEKILNVMEREKVTDCILFPFMIYDMLNVPNLSNLGLGSLKRIASGGDTVVPWAIEQLHENLPNVGFTQVYGLTEGTPIATTLDPEDALEMSHTVGKTMPFAEVKIVDDDANTLEYNEIGEICIKSPTVSLGYWRKPLETAETFRNGWCHTGDLGSLDENGYLTIAGRKKDMIRSGGENVYAAEVEDIFMRHPSVKDVAVIGVPDPKYIEAVCAIIVLNAGELVTDNELLEFSKEKIASYKKPKKIIFTEELPRNASGKVQKFMLKEQFS